MLTAIALVVNSTVADPGCVAGKAAILDNAAKPDEAGIQATIDGLNAAAAKAKHDDVRAAVKTMADDYTQMQTAMKTGKAPAGIEEKVAADGDAFDALCSLGN